MGRRGVTQGARVGLDRKGGRNELVLGGLKYGVCYILYMTELFQGPEQSLLTPTWPSVC